MKSIKKSISYIILSIFGLFMVMPFAWMLITSAKSQIEVNKPKLSFLPIDDFDVINYQNEKYNVKIIKTEGEYTWIHIFDKDGKIKRPFYKIKTDRISHERKFNIHWENYKRAFKKVPFGRYFLNTLIVSFLTVLGVIFTSSLAAYAFARMRFKGSDALFYVFISMMMVPQPIYLIPSYVLMNHLGWIDTYCALIIPWMANIFTIFLLRQHFKTIPQDLFDAAMIDGCSTFEILWKIILPISKSVLATASVFALISSWNSFMWPLVMTNSEELRVLQVGLSYFSQESSSQTTLLMAASSFSILPLIVVFLFAQKRIISSFASTGLKG
ncbi:MAG: carbohydrate ABC transporter permease [Candidatus Cloacimonadota bacterium]|nr:carbohydrate ABC transporter permease [Candidatus Cloacimonadota bacterium]